MVNTLHIQAGQTVVSSIIMHCVYNRIHFYKCDKSYLYSKLIFLISFIVYQCHISGHSLETLPLSPGVRRFCVFSIAFSSDGTEILGGANDQCLYVYDLECQQRILRVCRVI